MDRLLIYDTSNFVNFPIGGQLTSIRNFLTYISDKHPEFVKNILLIGITTEKDNVGKLDKINISGKNFFRFSVLYRDPDLHAVSKSLRIEYLKGLFRYRKSIPISTSTIHYLHTPEAFIAIKLLYRRAKIAVFSHGSFFNMIHGFRFFSNNKIVGYCFNKFIIRLITQANLIFVLDETSLKQYKKYNNNIILVNNSIILPPTSGIRELHTPVRLLFVGRLSKVKGVSEILNAVKILEGKVELTVVGDGELREELITQVKNLNLNQSITFTGAVTPENVKKYMLNNDILVMNSSIEGKPMAIIEAFSYGIPVITTLVGGIGELVKSSENAIITDGGAKSIANALIEIVNNYSKFSHNAWEASKRFDYVQVNEEIFELLQML